MSAAPEANAALWRELRDVYDRVDPVPAEVMAVAYGALAFRDLDAQLGRLVADSVDDLATNVRDDAATARLITFEADALVIEVEVAETSPGQRRMVGQLIAPGAATVTGQWPDGERTVAADDLGRFVLDAVPAGPVRLRCERVGEDVVVTGWLVV